MGIRAITSRAPEASVLSFDGDPKLYEAIDQIAQSDGEEMAEPCECCFLLRQWLKVVQSRTAHNINSDPDQFSTEIEAIQATAILTSRELRAIRQWIDDAAATGLRDDPVRLYDDFLLCRHANRGATRAARSYLATNQGASSASSDQGEAPPDGRGAAAGAADGAGSGASTGRRRRGAKVSARGANSPAYRPQPSESWDGSNSETVSLGLGGRTPSATHTAGLRSLAAVDTSGSGASLTGVLNREHHMTRQANRKREVWKARHVRGTPTARSGSQFKFSSSDSGGSAGGTTSTRIRQSYSDRDDRRLSAAGGGRDFPSPPARAEGMH